MSQFLIGNVKPEDDGRYYHENKRTCQFLIGNVKQMFNENLDAVKGVNSS